MVKLRYREQTSGQKKLIWALALFPLFFCCAPKACLLAVQQKASTSPLRSDERLFNLVRLSVKNEVCKAFITGAMLITSYAAVAPHTPQKLMDHFPWSRKSTHIQVKTQAPRPPLQRATGHLHLHHSDVFKRDIQALDMGTKSWEALAADCAGCKAPWTNTSKCDQKLERCCSRQGGQQERARQCKHDLQPETDVTSVIETATCAKDFSVTTRAAPEEQTRSLPTTLVNPDRQRLRVIRIYERVSWWKKKNCIK